VIELIAIAFFIVAVLAIWLLLFSGAREAVLKVFRGIGSLFLAVVNACGRAVRRISRIGGSVATGAAQSGHAVRDTGTSLWKGLKKHYWILILALLVLAVPPILILVIWPNPTLEPFPEKDWSESTSMIAQLMRGERLVPPQAPPPEVFTTAEIRRIRPEIVTADRRWDQINPELQQRVLAIYEVMRREGYQMVLVEGYRSPERQAELMEKGLATRAGAWQSCHQYGFAVDSAPFRDGKLQWDMNDEWTRRAYFLYGELAEQAGLEWGGRWRSIKDYVHVEMRAECQQARKERRAQMGSE
jgi:peptidoglycan L-alanyl-D-glutamate endopeptidase CwlK